MPQPFNLPRIPPIKIILGPNNYPFAINGTWFDYPYDSVYDCSINNIPGTSGQKDIWLAYTHVVKNVGILYWNVLYRDTSTVSWKLLRSHIIL
jgi:hypothetical protein